MGKQLPGALTGIYYGNQDKVFTHRSVTCYSYLAITR